MESIHFSPLQVELTMFFQENPYTFETVNGLAIRLGRNIEDLHSVLNQLVDNMILEVIGTGDTAIYRYIQPDFMDLHEEEKWKRI
ncbi:hypothetical protein BTR23_24130 [Alkalihalophilus pseudofirmus]|nr:hypothetical protein BTR23_24130 [Alkalihalophilus pseudofirmus]